MQTALARPGLISLAAGFTDHESLPVDDVRELLETLLSSRQRGRRALQYGSTQGDPHLRELTVDHLRKLDAIAKSHPAYRPERTIISNGSQQLLYMLTEALCDPGDIVLVEDPTYFVYLGILQSHGIEARGVKIDRDGADPESLAEVLATLKKKGELRRVKALYLVSYFQNPTGTTTTLQRKRAVLEVLRDYEGAAGHPLYLLEDAAYRELRFAGEDVKSALSLKGAADRVVYAGTYSKPFATGTRVGFGILPEPLFTAVLRIKGNHDFGTSNLMQQLLAAALASGRYAKHLKVLQSRYGRKADVMAKALKKVFPSTVEWTEPAGGLYFWARLPSTVKTGTASKLFKGSLANGVLYVPGELCYADEPGRSKPNCEMRLSFGSARELDIRKGIQRLSRALQAG